MAASDCCAQYDGFMREAIGEASKAVLAGNHPFGAVLLVDGEIVLRAQVSPALGTLASVVIL
jgi:tRNA(Arg) A34 adenosine deaminase TadA